MGAAVAYGQRKQGGVGGTNDSKDNKGERDTESKMEMEKGRSVWEGQTLRGQRQSWGRGAGAPRTGLDPGFLGGSLETERS